MAEVIQYKMRLETFSENFRFNKNQPRLYADTKGEKNRQLNSIRITVIHISKVPDFSSKYLITNSFHFYSVSLKN